MIEADRIINAVSQGDDEAVDRAIRPKLLSDYTGQPHVCEQMEIFIEAARKRQDALDLGPCLGAHGGEVIFPSRLA